MISYAFRPFRQVEPDELPEEIRSFAKHNCKLVNYGFILDGGSTSYTLQNSIGEEIGIYIHHSGNEIRIFLDAEKPHLPDNYVDDDALRHWVAQNIRQHATFTAPYSDTMVNTSEEAYKFSNRYRDKIKSYFSEP